MKHCIEKLILTGVLLIPTYPTTATKPKVVYVVGVNGNVQENAIYEFVANTQIDFPKEISANQACAVLTEKVSEIDTYYHSEKITSPYWIFHGCLRSKYHAYLYQEGKWKIEKRGKKNYDSIVNFFLWLCLICVTAISCGNNQIKKPPHFLLLSTSFFLTLIALYLISKIGNQAYSKILEQSFLFFPATLFSLYFGYGTYKMVNRLI